MNKNGVICYNRSYGSENTELMNLCISDILNRYVMKTDIVLDNFGGTGTTAVCCSENGIRNISIELSEKQCEYAVNRIKK